VKVATFGIVRTRFEPVMPSTLMRPACARPRAVAGLAQATPSVSPNRSLWAAASALYGTWTRSMPDCRFSSSPNRCAFEPLPQVP
jgi:hypothetical protein